VQGTDGNFYGTTVYGGAVGDGTVFKIGQQGSLTTLFSFDGAAHGSSPYAGLVQGGDGNFYGTTFNGGANTWGTIFEITAAGTLTTLYNFCSQPNCTDGGASYAGLVQGIDGNFYGTTSAGGGSNLGTVFDITPGGMPQTLHSFCPQTNCINSDNPQAALLQDTNGNFYGTTFGSLSGRRLGGGTVFGLTTGLGPFIAFGRSYGKVGQTFDILGQGFIGTTAASINGTPMTFTVLSGTFINATLPGGATTGPVTVTTPGGTLTSNVPFHVIP